MSNEEIGKRFLFDLNIGYFKKPTGNIFSSIYKFNKNNTIIFSGGEIVKLIKILKLENFSPISHEFYYENRIGNYVGNELFIVVDFINKKYFINKFVIRDEVLFNNTVQKIINEIPEYINDVKLTKPKEIELYKITCN